MTDNQNSDIEQAILKLAGCYKGYTVPEYARKVGVSESDIRLALEKLKNRGKITSTPDWKYRRTRRLVDADNPQ